MEIDHTPLDLFIIDEKTWLPIGRPTLTVVIDHYSRMILGYYLSFSPPSAEAVVGALRHAILPKKKRQVLLKRLEWVNEWPCYGVFEEAFLDNGLEFHGTDLEGIALDLEIGLIFCPKRKPRFKGVVERVLKTINHHFLHQIPGATFARFHLRGDYDPEKHALLTLTEVTEVIEKWIVDIYHQDVHRGINDIPFKRWTQSAQLHEPKLPASLDTLKRRIGKTKSCKLRRDGVVVDNIRYSSPDLQRIMNRYGEGVEVRVVYDPEDMGEVLLWGPDDEEPVSVLATDLEYAKGLTARQNAWITVRTHLELGLGKTNMEYDSLQLFLSLASLLDVPVRATPFDATEMGQRLYFACDGKVSYIKSLLHAALLIALEQDLPVIDAAVLEQAFTQAIWANGLGKINPFSQDFVMRRLDRGGEPFEKTLYAKQAE